MVAGSPDGPWNPDRASVAARPVVAVELVVGVAVGPRGARAVASRAGPRFVPLVSVLVPAATTGGGVGALKLEVLPPGCLCWARRRPQLKQ